MKPSMFEKSPVLLKDCTRHFHKPSPFKSAFFLVRSPNTVNRGDFMSRPFIVLPNKASFALLKTRGPASLSRGGKLLTSNSIMSNLEELVFKLPKTSCRG